MFFNKKRKENQRRIVRFSDVDSMVIETEGMHFELLPREYAVKYRNVISPRDGGIRFPDGYFDEHKSHIPYNTMNLMSIYFERLFTNLTPEDHLDCLPPGAVRDAYMRISLSGSMVYYTNTHSINDGCQIKIDPVADEFIQIVQLLKPFCCFPEFFPSVIQGKKSQKFLEKIYAKIESDGTKRLIGYRFDATGVFGYTFYTTCNKVCSASTIVAPSAPVMIHGNGVKWRSDFDNCTIFPGLTRSINDESNGMQLFQIVYKDRGEYVINDSITVYCDEVNYAFYCNDIAIAKIIKFSDNPDHFKKPSDTYYDYEPYFDVIADSKIDTDLLMVILAFPMLRFGF